MMQQPGTSCDLLFLTIVAATLGAEDAEGAGVREGPAPPSSAGKFLSLRANPSEPMSINLNIKLIMLYSIYESKRQAVLKDNRNPLILAKMSVITLINRSHQVTVNKVKRWVTCFTSFPATNDKHVNSK